MSISIDPTLHYLIMQLSPEEEGGFEELSPASIQPLDAGFFEWVDERKNLVVEAHKLNSAYITFRYGLQFVDSNLFDPEGYGPDGDAPEEWTDLESFRKTLAPYWEKLGEDGFILISGAVLDELGLAEMEELEDFHTAFEYSRLEHRETEGETGLFYTVEVERKHSYERWGPSGTWIDYDGLQGYRK